MPPRGVATIAAITAIVGCGSMIQAAVPDPASSGPMATSLDAGSLLARARNAAAAGDCPLLFELLDPALPRLTTADRATAQLLRVPCLASGGRDGEIAALYRELSVSMPRDPTVRSLGVVVAFAGGDAPEAARRLASLAADDPSALSSVRGALAQSLFQVLTERGAIAERDRLFLALAAADWQPQDRPDLRGSLAQGAVEALLVAGKVDEARLLLPRINAPETLVGMASKRRYAPLWPDLDAMLGPHANIAVDRFAAARLDAYANRPDDTAARREATRSFLLLGRLADAARIAEAVAITPTMSEADVVTVRLGAQAAAARGQSATAIARLTALTQLPIARTPTAAAAWVGLAELLDDSGRPEEALAVSRSGLAEARPGLSDWGRGWLRRSEICALSRLGRTGEARPLGDALLRDAGQSPAAAAEALLCLGRQDEAADLVVATLSQRDGADAIADQFQPEQALWAPSASRFRDLWRRLLDRPAVKAAFESAARIVPERLWPERSPRPVPRLARPDDLPVA